MNEKISPAAGSGLLARLGAGAAATVLLTTALAAATGTPAAAVARADIVAVAQGQLGNAGRNQEQPTGSGCNYYTGYFRSWKPAGGCPATDGVQWRNSDWCADFAKYVWKNAGVSDADVAEGDGGILTGWASSFRDYGAKHGTWHARSSGYQPQPGDAIVFDWTQNGEIDHVGIVKSATGTTVHTIEGNSGNRIKENSYSRTDADIVGYSAPVGADSGTPTAPPFDGSGDGDVRADFNGDGLGDVAAFYDYPGGRTGLFVWTAKSGGFNTPALVWDSGLNNWDQWRTKPVAGDFNGDGLGDVAAFYDYPGSRTGLFVWTAKSGGFNTPAMLWDSGAGNWDQSRTKPVAGDFNGDGLTDLGGFYDYPGSRTALWVWTAKSGGFDTPALLWDSGTGNWDQSRTKPVAGDFNGDGLGDLGAFYDYPGGRTALWIWSAKTGGFNTPAMLWDSGAGNWDQPRTKPVTGDFNGDGLGDLGAFYDYPGGRTGLFLWMAKSGGFNTPGLVWDSGAGNWEQPRTKPVTGDFNGDRLTDLGAFYDYPGGRTALWTWTARSGGVNSPAMVWDSGPNNWDQSRTKPV
ncbi:CHAP domain-containing protein [Nonomuraea gerenzanensis]|uniref:Putative secreted esterase n=1 Tax=Nonomuraea gerenzanensis TaxID=93944 RepID=A0A1M4EDI0_9ACTN|nr:CHAP domain-containing protein [Nonomuraea gerenzanensis]UBU08522.1 CHAP domain-containing protein [Nonomuraea gerenzanensis]SBO96870.1 putative secreted esterase [Nonomuraea gerenzanensis]